MNPFSWRKIISLYNLLQITFISILKYQNKLVNFCFRNCCNLSGSLRFGVRGVFGECGDFVAFNFDIFDEDFLIDCWDFWLLRSLSDFRAPKHVVFGVCNDAAWIVLHMSLNNVSTFFFVTAEHSMKIWIRFNWCLGSTVTVMLVI